MVIQQKVDLFTPIHKAIRALLYDMGEKLQVADLGEKQEMEITLDHLEHLLELLEEHARHEDRFIFPEIEKVIPGSTEESEQEHQQFDRKAEHLQRVIRQIRAISSAEKRIELSEKLNRAFTDFISFYMMHMNHEEEDILPLSIKKLSAEKLSEIRVKVQMDTAPERYSEWLHWMLPALNINELLPLFEQVKTSAPAPVYQKFKTIGKKTIEQNRWNKLCRLANIF